MGRTNKDNQTLQNRIVEYASRKRLSERTGSRLLTLSEKDGLAFFYCLEDLGCGENHTKDLLDWVEEIAIRDECRLEDVLNGEAVSRARAVRGTRNDRLKAVKRALRKVRYPRLTRLEEDAKATIRALDLPRSMKVSFPDHFEGNGVTLTLEAANTAELAELVGQLQKLVAQGSFDPVFNVVGDF